MELKKVYQKLQIVFSCLVAIIVFGNTQQQPEPPMEINSVGIGAQASSIDLYIVFLAAAAILFIVYYARKYKTQKA